MAYNSNLPNFYQPQYYQPPMGSTAPDYMRQAYQQAPQMPQAAPQPPTGGITWVQGEDAAKAFLVAAGNSVLLMDSEKTTFYIKSTDQSGMPLPLRVFDYQERTAGPKLNAQEVFGEKVDYATKEELAALEAKIDAIMAKPEKQSKSQKEEVKNA